MPDIFDDLREIEAETWDQRQVAVVPADRSMAGRFTSAADALIFLRASKATLTVKSVKTGTRFTYRVTKAKPTEGRESYEPIFFVALMNGPDNESNYQYFGYIKRGVFYHGGAKAKVSASAQSVKAFAWTYNKLVAGLLPDELEIWHEGRCGRCGRKLTVPESISSGFGPECIGHVH